MKKRQRASSTLHANKSLITTSFSLVSLINMHYLATILALFRLLFVRGSTRKIVQNQDKVELPHGMDPCTCMLTRQWPMGSLVGAMLLFWLLPFSSLQSKRTRTLYLSGISAGFELPLCGCQSEKQVYVLLLDKTRWVVWQMAYLI